MSESIEEAREALLGQIKEAALATRRADQLKDLAAAFVMASSNKPPRSAYEDHDVTVV